MSPSPSASPHPPPAWEAISGAFWLACGEASAYGSGYWNTRRQTHRWCFTFTPERKWLTDWMWLGSLCPCTSGVCWMEGGAERGRGVWSGKWHKHRNRACVSVCRGQHDMCVLVLTSSFLWMRGCLCIYRVWRQKDHDIECFPGRFCHFFLSKILILLLL